MTIVAIMLDTVRNQAVITLAIIVLKLFTSLSWSLHIWTLNCLNIENKLLGIAWKIKYCKMVTWWSLIDDHKSLNDNHKIPQKDDLLSFFEEHLIFIS